MIGAVCFTSLLTAMNALIIVFMPKYLSRQEMYVTWGIVDLISFMVDGYLGGACNLYYLSVLQNSIFHRFSHIYSVRTINGTLYIVSNAL